MLMVWVAPPPAATPLFLIPLSPPFPTLPYTSSLTDIQPLIRLKALWHLALK